MRSVGIWRPGGVGDCLLLAPALRALRAARPGVAIHVWGNTDACYLMLHMGLLDSFGDHRQGIRLSGAPPDMLVGFEWNPTTFATHASHLGMKHAVVKPWIGGRGVHQSKHHHDAIVEALGVAAPHNPDAPFSLQTTEVVRRANRQWSGATLMYGGAGMNPKKYPAKRFLDVARMLRIEGHDVVLLEGPEDDYGDTLGIPILNRPWIDIAWLLQDARCYIGCDTGITHLAGMLGTPTVGLFGPTQSRTWRPIGRNVSILNRCPRMSMTDEVVYDANHDCFADLSAREVVDAVLLLGERAVGRIA